MTSDAGLVLIAQLDKQYQINNSSPQAFRTERDPKRCNTLEDLIARCMDWCKDTQTLNDHDQLRFDPMFGGGG